MLSLFFSKKKMSWKIFEIFANFNEKWFKFLQRFLKKNWFLKGFFLIFLSFYYYSNFEKNIGSFLNKYYPILVLKHLLWLQSVTIKKDPTLPWLTKIFVFI